MRSLSKTIIRRIRRNCLGRLLETGVADGIHHHDEKIRPRLPFPGMVWRGQWFSMETTGEALKNRFCQLAVLGRFVAKSSHGSIRIERGVVFFLLKNGFKVPNY